MDISGFTEGELMAWKKAIIVEIQRRESEQFKKQQNKLPQAVGNPDFKAVIEYCQEYIKTLNETGEHMRNFEENASDLILEAVYGEGIWDWFREVDK